MTNILNHLSTKSDTAVEMYALYVRLQQQKVYGTNLQCFMQLLLKNLGLATSD